MKAALTFLAAALLAAPLNAQQAQALWDRTSVGMSPEAVRALYPAVVPGAADNIIESTGAHCALKLASHALGGDAYSIDFCFLGGRLASVALGTVDGAQTSGFAGRRDRLLAYLRARHGEPTGQLTSPESHPGLVITAWEQGCFKLYLIAASRNDQDGMVVASFNGNECPGAGAR